MISGSVANFI